ncbi:hypothetical protein PSAB6_650051 [Paraburkholderia sabiae]|nr:hypothetical protein PSAB6_650051 [Paraburkholderia sabiae]
MERTSVPQNILDNQRALPRTSVPTLIESQHASSTMNIHLACELLRCPASRFPAASTRRSSEPRHSPSCF